MTRALVTGSTGGLGANLVAALNQRGIEVVGLCRKTSPQDAVGDLKMTQVVGDITDLESLRPAVDGVDWVFHVAAIADDWNFPAEVIYQANLEGARNMLTAALEAGVRRFVLTGSTAALGKPTPGKPLMDEDNVFNIEPEWWPYGHSKYLASLLLPEFVEKGLEVVGVLPSAIMGPRDLKFISGELIVRVLKRSLLPFPEGGINFIDVRDCAEAHIAAAEKGRPGERYVLAGHNLTHGETLQTIGDVVGVRPRRIKIPRWILPPLSILIDGLHKAGFKQPVERTRVLLSGEYMYYDNSKAVQELGLQIRPFAETVRDAYQWYVDHGYLERRGIDATKD